MNTKKIVILGMGRAGKDTACEYLAKITTLRNAGTTSKYLAGYMAQKLGLPVYEAYRRRHESDEMRTAWYNGGNELRAKGPTTLLRMALENGEITGGLRDLAEVQAAKSEGLADIIIWVENSRVPTDPTVMFSERECDVVIQNNWSLEEFHERLRRFAEFAGLPMRHRGGHVLSSGVVPAWLEPNTSYLPSGAVEKYRGRLHEINDPSLVSDETLRDLDAMAVEPDEKTKRDLILGRMPDFIRHQDTFGGVRVPDHKMY